MMIVQTLVGGLSGAIVGLVVARLFIERHKDDARMEAYEEGWSNGYDVGLKANRPKRTRTRKADA